MRHALFPLSDIEPGSMQSVEVGSVRVVVVRKRDGSLRALRDVCPHRGARLSNGKLARQVVGEAPGARRLTETEVVLCPWHGFEFDVDGGRCVARSRPCSGTQLPHIGRRRNDRVGAVTAEG